MLTRQLMSSSNIRSLEWRHARHRMLLTLVTLSLVASVVRGEGSAQLGEDQGLLAETPLFVDILESGETINWTGNGSATIRRPDGTTVSVLNSGQTHVTLMAGVYEVVLSDDQTGPWSIATGGALGGRLWSPLWSFDTGSFSEAQSTNASIYAKVEGGGGEGAVIEMKLDGLSGGAYRIHASRIGADPERAGRSVGLTVGLLAPETPLYVNPPQSADYTFTNPLLSEATHERGGNGRFSFRSNIEGTYHIVCDLDGDGKLDPVAQSDRVVIGIASPGINHATWDGTDNAGNVKPAGTYTCRILLRAGETHFVLEDVETSFEGLRLFQVDPTATRSGLRMFWNDSLVQADAVIMPNGDVGAETSGPIGVDPGPYLDPATPHGEEGVGNARAWGNFGEAVKRLGKGDGAFLDTSGWLASASSSDLTFSFDPVPIFSDGFESASTGAWSSSSPSP